MVFSAALVSASRSKISLETHQKSRLARVGFFIFHEPMKSTLLVLGDQLTLENTALEAGEIGRDRVLLLEGRDSGAAHKIKRVFHLAALRAYAEELRSHGWEVEHHRLADTPNFREAILGHLKKNRPSALVAMEPNNWSQQKCLEEVAAEAGIPLRLTPTCQFLTPRAEFLKFAQGKKRLLMETHYRRMRQDLGILMRSDGEPEGGAWNYDAENRKTVRDWKKDGAPKPPSPVTSQRPAPLLVQEAITDVNRWFPNDPGRAEDFWLPHTREGALEMLEQFIEKRLPLFGDYQDLMLEDSSTMFHSVIAGPLNLGLLLPMECIDVAGKAYREGRAPLAAVEGFVRQILGWREFVNGVYWLKMPDYLASNALGATQPLPEFFYSAKTDMHCLQRVIGEARDSAYNHHIQRLMILGNFCLLAGINPQQAHDWFLEMYIDAHEWVMAANVLGMALHADGGFMATKPYAGSAAYISKMSNYCSGCTYDPAKKSGPGACPFNLLYWDFYDRHAARFASNPRTSMMVNSWKKRPEPEREKIKNEARQFLEKLV
jgi:deoxyribodipyrimidine photolyase-related protein